MSVAEFVSNIFGFPLEGELSFIFYIITAIFGLVLLDGVISLFFGFFTSLFKR